jgi:thiol-disulfide isomerase/thioredoxin
MGDTDPAMDDVARCPMSDRSGRSLSVAVLMILGIALSGCASSAGSTAGVPSSAPVDAVPSALPEATQTTTPTAEVARPSAPAPSAPAVGVVLDQEWAAVGLVDVSTGETFRIADHAGKVIILETMAIWCVNCRAQQRDVKTALGELPAESVSYIVLDVDPNEDGPSLAAYRDQQGFEGRYAIAGTTVARALAAEFGDQVLNPPSTPMVFIGTDGRVTLTEFGHKSPDEIVALARAHGA